jgi:hypothetical protein
VIGRRILLEEEASANYVLRKVSRRRTGEITWEVIDAASGTAVATGLLDREEALRLVRGWERLNGIIEGGLPGHRLPH